MLDLNSFLPKKIDNTFVGNRVALWFFYLLTVITLWRSQHHLFAPDGGAQSIATIPLNAYSSEAASTVIGIFALWGLSQLIIGFMYLAVCIRYKALIPMMYFLGVIEYGMRAFYVGGYKPIETANEAPGALINVPFMLLFSLMLVLSIWRKNKLNN